LASLVGVEPEAATPPVPLPATRPELVGASPAAPVVPLSPEPPEPAVVPEEEWPPDHATPAGKEWYLDSAAPPAEPPSARPAFTWQQVGTSLLSERTLNALLGLGTFLILAAGVVISTLNPTGLAPLLHLGAGVVTTVVFYALG
jgi:hypothetical protein